MLTRRGKGVVAGAAVLWVAGRALGVSELFALSAAALAVVALAILRVRLPLRLGLSSSVHPRPVDAGARAELELSVENRGPRATPAAGVELTGPALLGCVAAVPRLPRGERAALAVPVSTARRGRHETAAVTASLGDGLGLARRKIALAPPARYAVRPAREELSSALPSSPGTGDSEMTGSSAARLRSGSSLLRPYVEGDDPRRVHWPTTARTGELMVRQGGDREGELPAGLTVVLAWRFLGDEAAFEQAVSAAASVVSAASREGPFRLVVGDDADTGRGTGPRHLERALDLLTDVRGVPVEAAIPPSTSPFFTGGDAAVFIAACDRPTSLGLVLGAEPESLVSARRRLVLVSVGGVESRVEGTAERLLVTVAAGQSLSLLWGAGRTALIPA